MRWLRFAFVAVLCVLVGAGWSWLDCQENGEMRRNAHDYMDDQVSALNTAKQSSYSDYYDAMGDWAAHADVCPHCSVPDDPNCSTGQDLYDDYQWAKDNWEVATWEWEVACDVHDNVDEPSDDACLYCGAHVEESDWEDDFNAPGGDSDEEYTKMMKAGDFRAAAYGQAACCCYNHESGYSCDN